MTVSLIQEELVEALDGESASAKVRGGKENRYLASGLITSWQIDGETMETGQTLFSQALTSLRMVTAAMKLKNACSLEEKL